MKFKRTAAAAGAFLLLAVLFTGCANTNKDSDSDSSSGVDLSSFTAVDISGQERDQSIITDNTLTMVNVWATFCGPCKRELGDLGDIARDYSDKGVGVVGIVADVLDSNGDVNQDLMLDAQMLISDNNIAYINLLPSEDLYNAFLSDVYSVPTTMFFDSDGHQVGDTVAVSKSYEEWAKIIDEHLDSFK